MQPVDPLVIEWIDSMSTTPAFVRDSEFEVLASNRIARALTSSLTAGTNLARATFFDPNAKLWLPEWKDVSDHVVAVMKDETRAPSGSGTMSRLIGELSSKSDQFSIAWAAGAQLPDSAIPVVLAHPQVGTIEITFQLLALPDDSNQTLALAHVFPGSASEARLFELAALAQTDEDDVS